MKDNPPFKQRYPPANQLNRVIGNINAKIQYIPIAKSIALRKSPLKILPFINKYRPCPNSNLRGTKSGLSKSKTPANTSKTAKNLMK